ncbi:binding-protein-dependent transport systems inner membrane component [Tolumonas auensis DSM 9187]|jgi:putrescine transport system permease protein|uniref:Binding-protein-dependent transport systems inner membrane component n=1 Tax=Tolumonas auensis (strain DSM 9187 / NBRC 110442 / TA 4) TaxID=595494 RepID=C4LBT2_TOLAT|nr:ABC transporter permease subunit [Tolumonas auensis]ACQ94356.1 binding-protein-dependent transport systems inner membrane component [Tolumonas auensis DSM 9187]NCB57189.1 ABC transporter permease subunit [Gammaproteobacteria bacterium]
MTPIPQVKSKFRTFILLAGFGFLYVPILLLIVYSFNESRLVTVWSGFSVKWYGELFADNLMMNGVILSLTIGVLSASMAVVIGTLAAFVLTRIGNFRGQTSFAFLITAPMVMPEVITGLALLLLFVAMSNMFGWPAQRGAMTIWIAHVTFTAAYVTVIVRSRLQELDLSIEEAAQDLGATPFKVFFLVTLPSIAPAIAAGWLLGFTLSVDDLVITSFVSGPNATTLPMVVFSSVRLGVSPKINALATLIILVVSIATFIGWWMMASAEKRRKAEIKAAMQNG